MANTYDKTLVTATFKLVNGETLVSADTTAKTYGQFAFDQFMNGDIAEVVTAGGDHYFVPFHAVVWAKKEATKQQASYDDENCKKTCDC